MDYIIIYVLLVPVFIITLIILGVVAFFNNHNRNTNNMDPNQMKQKISAKDFSLNLGAFIALYTLVASLLNLLFTVINVAYPQITKGGYNYVNSSSSISWPVSTLIVFFPIFVLLMWFLEREYRTEPEAQNNAIHRGLTYITLFVSGVVIVGDLVTVVYYFIDGQELTTGFLLKVLVLLVVASGMFVYYISDLRGKLTKHSRIIWRLISGFLIALSIIWGFSVLGSPRTQQLLKYDEQKVNDLQSLSSVIQTYYQQNNHLPSSLNDLNCLQGSTWPKCIDSQTGKAYEYVLVNKDAGEYQLCAVFNKDSKDSNTPNYYITYPNSWNASWTHPAGQYCFKEKATPSAYPKPVPIGY